MVHSGTVLDEPSHRPGFAGYVRSLFSMAQKVGIGSISPFPVPFCSQMSFLGEYLIGFFPYPKAPEKGRCVFSVKAPAFSLAQGDQSCFSKSCRSIQVP